MGSRWSVAERAKVFAALESAPKAEVRAVFPVLPTTNESTEGIRLAAATQGADAVLIVSGAGETVVSPNGLAFGYLLVAPLFFLHGNDIETLFLTRAALWDVRNEYLYMAVEGEASSLKSRPFALPEARESVIEAKIASLENLCEGLKKEMTGLFTAL